MFQSQTDLGSNVDSHYCSRITLPCLSFSSLLLELLLEVIDEVDLAYGLVHGSLWKNVDPFLFKGSL